MSIIKTWKEQLAILSLLALTIFSSGAAAISAPSASLTITPATQTVTNGSPVSVGISVNSGLTPIRTIDVKINYPAANLTYNSVSYSGSLFEVQPPPVGGGGSVALTVSTVTPTTGSQPVATIHFTAKTTGPVTLSLGCTYNAACFDGNLVLESSDGANIYPPSWASLGGGFLTGPAAALNTSPTNLNVFGVGADKAIWQRTFTLTSTGTWSSLGGGFLTGPAATFNSTNNHIDVYGIGLDKAVWQRTYNGTTWGAWTSLGGGFSSGPTAAVDSSNGHMSVYGIGLDKAIWQRTSTNGVTWTAWTSIGGGFSSGPAAAADSSSIFLYGVGLDQSIWQRTYNGSSWGSWSSLGGHFISGPAVTTLSKRIDLYGVGLDKAVWHSADTSSWSAWTSLGGGSASGPAATVDSNGDTNVFMVGLDNAIWNISP